MSVSSGVCTSLQCWRSSLKLPTTEAVLVVGMNGDLKEVSAEGQRCVSQQYASLDRYANMLHSFLSWYCYESAILTCAQQHLRKAWFGTSLLTIACGCLCEFDWRSALPCVCMQTCPAGACSTTTYTLPHHIKSTFAYCTINWLAQCKQAGTMQAGRHSFCAGLFLRLLYDMFVSNKAHVLKALSLFLQQAQLCARCWLGHALSDTHTCLILGFGYLVHWTELGRSVSAAIASATKCFLLLSVHS